MDNLIVGVIITAVGVAVLLFIAIVDPMTHLFIWLASHRLKSSSSSCNAMKHWRRRHDTIEWLGELQHPRAVDVLIEVLKADCHCGHCHWIAIKALGEAGDKRAVDTLLPYLSLFNHESGEACTALQKLGDPKAIDPLLETIADRRWSDWPERACSLWALASFANEKVVGPLIDLTNDPWESSTAVEGLEKNLQCIPQEIWDKELERIVDLEEVSTANVSPDPLDDAFVYYTRVDTKLIKQLAQEELNRRRTSGKSD